MYKNKRFDGLLRSLKLSSHHVYIYNIYIYIYIYNNNNNNTLYIDTKIQSTNSVQ